MCVFSASATGKLVIKNALVSDNIVYHIILYESYYMILYHKLCFLESIVYYPHHLAWDAHPSTPLWTLMFRDVQGACTNLGVVQCEHGERLDIGQSTHKAKAGWSGDHEVKDCGVVKLFFLGSWPLFGFSELGSLYSKF